MQRGKSQCSSEVERACPAWQDVSALSEAAKRGSPCDSRDRSITTVDYYVSDSVLTPFTSHWRSAMTYYLAVRFQGRDIMRSATTVLFTALLLGTTGSEACSVVEFAWAGGLAAHLSNLWTTLPALYGSNGSVYIDNAGFPYRCTEQGGWHDFFETEDGFLQPWTPAVASTHQCEYYEYGEMSKASKEIGISHIQSRFDPGVVRKASPSFLSWSAVRTCTYRF